MLLPFSLLLALLAHRAFILATPAKRFYDTHYYYVLEHDPYISTGASLAEIAQSLGVEVVEQAGELKDHWIVRTQKPSLDLESRSEEPEDPVLRRYENLRRQMSIAIRSEADHARRMISSIKYFEKQTLRRRVKRAPPPIRPSPKVSDDRAIATRLGIQDPLFPNQWHLINDEYPEHMMNATGVWAMGYTGKGVFTTLLDDGLDYEHVDLAANFVSPSFSSICLILT